MVYLCHNCNHIIFQLGEILPIHANKSGNEVIRFLCKYGLLGTHKQFYKLNSCFVRSISSRRNKCFWFKPQKCAVVLLKSKFKFDVEYFIFINQAHRLASKCAYLHYISLHICVQTYDSVKAKVSFRNSAQQIAMVRWEFLPICVELLPPDLRRTYCFFFYKCVNDLSLLLQHLESSLIQYVGYILLIYGIWSFEF